MASAIDMSLAADGGALSAVQAEVDAFCESHEVPPKAAYVLSLVIEELVTNVVNYAYGPGDDGPLEVSLDFSDGHIVGKIVDAGPPFDPTAMAAPDTTAEIEDRPIGGLGVHIVRTLAESVGYAREGERNVVRFSIAA